MKPITHEDLMRLRDIFEIFRDEAENDPEDMKLGMNGYFWVWAENVRFINDQIWLTLQLKALALGLRTI